jgi:xanthine dehydrogenase YagR molybdenum-binding subunit
MMLPLIGDGIDRADGRLKVTGAARYAAEVPLPNLCHAVLVSSTIAKGRVVDVDVDAGQRLPGVLAVLCFKNVGDGPLRHVPPNEPAGASQMPGATRMLTDQVLFYGQYVAVVVAKTLDQARHAAAALPVRYDAEPSHTDIDAGLASAVPPKSGKAKTEPADTTRGDPDGAYAAAPVKVRQTYATPHETHNPMEMHATTAAWDGDRLTLWDATQGVSASKMAVAKALGISPDDVRVIDPFVGGGFGSKGSTWPHVALTALAARTVGRPVRMMLERSQTFFGTGYRSPTRQTIALGADRAGQLLAFRHDVIAQTPTYSEYLETAALPTRTLYACENAATTHRVVHVDTQTPCQMRAPGEATGVLAFELAMDELAVELGMDPVELRLKNYATKDPQDGKPFSSKSLDQCYRQGAERFGWAKRNPKPRSTTDAEGNLVGYGMATATYPANRLPASATVTAYADGSVVVRSGTQDIGTGTYTIMAQVAAAELGLPPSAVRARLGDTTFPKAATSGGSTTAASVCTAIQLAAAKLREQLIAAAVKDGRSPLHGLSPDGVKAEGGKLVAKNDSSKSDPIRDVVARGGTNAMEFTATPDMFKDEQKAEQGFARHSFGAIFAEVRVDPRLGTVRVPRLVAAYAAGRILNAKTARSQLLGGLVFAHGMALLEETNTDHRTGQIVNASLAEYLVPVNADVHDVDVILVGEDDPHVNPIGVKGVGEIGIVGAPAAIANAVYHATGRRVRELPITPDKLL